MDDDDSLPPVPETPAETRPLSSAAAPGWHVEYAAATGSTNALAAARVAAGSTDRLAVVTNHQTAGRGRLDRGWETPADVALTVSLALDPGQPDDRWPWLPLLVGLAVVDAVEGCTTVRPTLKWPNDVLVEDRKLAGILVERVAGPGAARAVAGVGLNVHQRTLPVATATSLALEGATVDRVLLLEALLGAVDHRLADWAAAGGHARLRAAYRERCGSLGREVVAHLPGAAELHGRAVDIDEQGRILVDTGRATVPVGAGDVVHLRAAPGTIH